MKWRLLFVLPLILSTMGIRVPVDNVDKSEEISDSDTKYSSNQTQNKPIYYESDEPAVDSYLIPPDPHQPEEVLPDTIVTPATYLLPPTAEKQTGYYYAPTESGEQSDWYPIAQQPIPQNEQVQLLPPRPQSVAIPIFLSNENPSKPFKVTPLRTGKVLGDRFNIPFPSIKLEPPAQDAPNDYILQIPSEELELPVETIDQQYRPIQANFDDVHPNTHLSPPKPHHRKYKKPTKLFPKKFNSSFKPVPIPIAQFAEDSSLEVPRAKPAKYFKPLPGIEGLLPTDEKQIYLYEQAEEKRKVKDSEEPQEQQDYSSEKYVDEPPTEQDASETHYTYPGRYRGPAPYPVAPARDHSAPIRVAPAPAPIRVAPVAAAPIRVAPSPRPQAPPAPDDRTEFRMHGMKGPHSYQFGYDTGKGKNRQFRYEERDNDGLVKGHYGYMDRHGKLRVVNYRAHPEHGFQADSADTPEAPEAEENKE